MALERQDVNAMSTFAATRRARLRIIERLFRTAPTWQHPTLVRQWCKELGR